MAAVLGRLDLYMVLRQLSAWLTELRGSGYRGLVLLHSTAIGVCASAVAGLLSEVYSQVACIAPAELRRELQERCSRVLSPSAIEELLGTENDAVLLAVPGLLRPNLLAAAAETVRGGGVVVLVVPRLDVWQPGGGMSTGLYREYLLRSLGRLESLFWADADLDTVYSMRLPRGKARKPPGPEGYRARSPVHRKLLEAAATIEQAEALDKIVAHVRSRGRSILVLGDRGRGKSGLLGLAVAYIVASHMAGFVSVTAPSPANVQSFFRILRLALGKLGTRHWEIRRGNIVIGIAGPWFHVRYHTPDRADPGSFTVVDEAAALGPSRLRSIARRAPRLLAATTIHGYEGSGRVLAKIAEEILPEPRLVVELRTPVRYPPGDPLEGWLYDTFMLRVSEPEPPSLDGVELRPAKLDRKELVEKQQLLRAVYSILVSAHYRNEPDDLALLLDAPHHRVYVLLAGNTPVAVAHAALEGPELPVTARILPDILAQYAPEAGKLSGVRIVRIAVHSRLQRRGLGSKLLRYVEEVASSDGYDWVGAVFGRPDVLGFWLANNYTPIYVSPLPNKVTGEHNIAVVKPIANKAAKILGGVAAAARKRMLLASHSLYRGLPAEILVEIFSHQVPAQQPLSDIDEWQRYRLSLFLCGSLEAESVLDVLWLLLVNDILARGRLDLEDPKAELVAVMRILQGKTLADITAAIRVDSSEVRKHLRSLALLLAKRAGIEAGDSCEAASEPSSISTNPRLATS
ncbi:GNAT family N-acetyltransferase [Hyperthermus butylicus]|uniref:tRNA(Met) cytidine acetyltransferase TmcA n=1 Tax=Hyperthermus butylicus (strain DSM 5456 / JCM 9403 / PLM1-5) TaxID=415426 RepID=A2BLX9_HYPBU|nr:GNAT family N-acetyltransferase [Hyperthermus butylicus]ABM80990.1 P-loop ATPase [Hyperthermus butylicus DSM 5456]